MTSSHRLPLIQVGQIVPGPDGPTPDLGWQFSFLGKGRVPMVFEDGHMAGWSLAELHDIAHGSPCLYEGCPLG